MITIYKITNKTNNKVYIGRTKDFKRRMEAHKAIAFRNTEKNEKYNRPLYVEIRRDGLSNFTFEILEEVESVESSKERELYYMDKYKSCDRRFGYNILRGDVLDEGTAPNVKYDLDVIKQVIELLKTTTKTSKEISKEFGLSEAYINQINRGERRIIDDETMYPIRPFHSKQERQKLALNIIDDLINTNMKQRDIAKKYGVSRTCVTAINRGENSKQDGIEYPIRKGNRPIKLEVALLIIEDLKRSELTKQEIADKYEVTMGVIKYINSGRRWKQENQQYPIR